MAWVGPLRLLRPEEVTHVPDRVSFEPSIGLLRVGLLCKIVHYDPNLQRDD
jgi:hypothetical protein